MPANLVPRYLAEALYVTNQALTDSILRLHALVDCTNDQPMIDEILNICELLQYDAKHNLAGAINWIESKAPPAIPRDTLWD